MKTKLKPVTLKITWTEATEIVRLDLVALRAWAKSNPDEVMEISTYEIWKEEKREVFYRPKAMYHADVSGDHHISLTYVADEHPELPRNEIFWGVLSIVVNENLDGASANYLEIPGGEGSGKAKRCRVLKDDETKLGERTVLIRLAQAQFRADALTVGGGRCAITGETQVEALDAAHVDEVKDKGRHDVILNSLVLRADLHRLFDRAKFTITPEGKLIPGRNLTPEYKALLTERDHLDPKTVVRLSKALHTRSRNARPRS